MAVPGGGTQIIPEPDGGGATELTIEQDDIQVASPVDTLNFEGNGIQVTDEGSNKATMLVGNIVMHQLRTNLTTLPDGPLTVVDSNGDIVRSLV